MSPQQEGEEFIRRLERLCEGVGIEKPLTPISEDELLDRFEKFSKTKACKRSWIESADQLIWCGATWLWECRLFRQISVVRELGQVIGWKAPATLDALLELDDLAFAVTYGARVPSAIKDKVRAIAKKGLMAPYELRNLLRNHRLKLAPQGHVVAKESKYLMPTAVILFALSTIALVVPLSIGLWAPIAFFPKLAGTCTLSSLYLICCSLIASFLVIPHRLTPRIRCALVGLTQEHGAPKPRFSVITR